MSGLPLDLNHALATARVTQLRHEAEQRRLADCVAPPRWRSRRPGC